MLVFAFGLRPWNSGVWEWLFRTLGFGVSVAAVSNTHKVAPRSHDQRQLHNYGGLNYPYCFGGSLS